MSNKHFKHRLEDDRPRRFRSSDIANGAYVKDGADIKSRVMGTIKSFSPANGYGFVYPDDRRHPDDDLFFHINDCHPAEVSDLNTGQRVEFVIGERNGKPRAISVRLV
jgi:cold shock CspA family protein